MARSCILFPFVAALLAGGCGGATDGGGDPVVTPPPRPTAAIATSNELERLAGTPQSVNLNGRSGTAVLSGLFATDLTSGLTEGNRALVGETLLTVNFDSRTVTGNATRFAEVVASSNSGQITVSQWLQTMTGTLVQSGTLTNGGAGSYLTLTTGGNLTGTLSVNGQSVSGTFRVDANGNILNFLQKETTIYALGGGTQTIPSDLEVTFTPAGGGTLIRLCVDGICPTTGTGLSAFHLLKLQ